ncbi:MAG: TonB-dependent receptor plug domain-containing protein [Saprospiraceae bacterium]|nr:TonB-dependent receptor plug domain-containing protein [Saprospiraceae bacterium]
MKKTLFHLFTMLSVIALITVLNSCSSTKNTASERSAADPTADYQTLKDYLRRDPKVQIRGGGESITVMIRGANSFSGGVEPVFVLNGTPIANSYVQASPMVDVSAISSVKVLTPGEATAQFGQRGENGAVVIITKK